MATLREIVSHLDTELKTREVPDYPPAHNGLQLENSGDVRAIVSAVDASAAAIAAAARYGPALLLVHHGLFWQGGAPLTGPFFRKVKMAIDSDLAVYSSHIPLDVHPVWGNNVLLAKRIGISAVAPFFDFKGWPLGICGEWEGDLNSLIAATRDSVGGPIHVCRANPDSVGKVGIITGAAGSEIPKLPAHGVTTLITGEGPHWSYPLAEELGINVLYAGHYATETFGVRALGAHLEAHFSMPHHRLDFPTGL